MRRLLTALSGLVVFSVVAVGAKTTVWETKPFNTWTAEELKEILADSPWAGKGGISRIKSNGGSGQPIEEQILVTWLTSRPMREALVRGQIGPNGAMTKEIEAFLAQPQDAYIVSVKLSGSGQAGSYAARA